MSKCLLEKLKEYSESGYIPMHMPGGKRNTELLKMPNPYQIDITEIDGFDNLHNAYGIIKELSLRCAELFGADETLLLVNGSSAGILSAICGATKRGDNVLAARNCHRSVYNAIYLNELKPIYIYPEEIKDRDGSMTGIYGEITAESIEEKLSENPEITAVIITSPTYEGIVSNINKISKTVHQYGKILIVDEAHGAHFAFHKMFPESAVTGGADIVIQSIHKTLPSFTQTALLHMNGTRIDTEKVKRYWDIYQTTSPSYVLMAGIDNCMTILETQGKDLFSEYVENLLKLRNDILKLKNIRLLKTDDISKLVLLTADGKKLYNWLLGEFKIQLEMAAASYAIAMTSVCDTKEYYERFLLALQKIDNEISKETARVRKNCGCGKGYVPPVKMTMYEAVNRTEKEKILLKSAKGRIAGTSICFYPPGIPLINPGEEITEEVIKVLKEGIDAGLEVIGADIINMYTGIEKSEEGVYVTCLK